MRVGYRESQPLFHCRQRRHSNHHKNLGTACLTRCKCSNSPNLNQALITMCQPLVITSPQLASHQFSVKTSFHRFGRPRVSATVDLPWITLAAVAQHSSPACQKTSMMLREIHGKTLSLQLMRELRLSLEGMIRNEGHANTRPMERASC